MAKVLLDTEVADIVRRLVVNDEIDDADTYRRFLSDLGQLVCDYCGGEVYDVDAPISEPYAGSTEAETRWCVMFRWNDSLPEDGGVFARYDLDKGMEEWKEEAGGIQ